MNTLLHALANFMHPNKWWHYLLMTAVVGVLSAFALISLAATFVYPTLPSLEALTDYQPKLPLRVYSADGYLISEFGEERRAFVKIEEVPQDLKNAILAIEDRRFYKHGGVDTRGILRAIVHNFTSSSREGASTITMQVARNFFLSSERSYTRKIKEALLAIKIEHNLSKDKILELYINQIYLGQRAYGFAAAAQVYYGKPLNKLTLAETALLAGLPKAPNSYNPFLNPKRAIGRQKEVLHDMYRYGFITQPAYQQAIKQPLRFKASRQSRDLAADHVAEMVRAQLYERYQEEIYSTGMKVTTTIYKANQEAANTAVREGVLDYELRHGYRGPEKMLDLVRVPKADQAGVIQTALDEMEELNEFIPAVITQVSPKALWVRSKRGDDIKITGPGLLFVDSLLKQKDPAKRLLRPGAVVRIFNNKAYWQVVQLPQVESALVGLDPETGAIRALVGGFDFNRNKYNHVTQAKRQPGSSFKPFVYSAALEKGFTPASIIEDAPLNFSAQETGDAEWTPQNFDKKFDGNMRLRQALVKSKNMVSIRLLQAIGTDYAQDYITRFGFSAEDHPPYLTLALGVGSTSPWQMALAYAVFANGGYLVKPSLISKIEDKNGKVLFEQKLPSKESFPRVIDARNAFIMHSMMQDVVQHGTAMRALQLGRGDIAGKTGTTNDHVDAWFAGYNPQQVAVAWMGFDKPQSLGSSETGGAAALPIWIRYMATALHGLPERYPAVPEGVSVLKIDTTTGAFASQEANSRYEYFYHENPPAGMPLLEPPAESDAERATGTAPTEPPTPQNILIH